MYASADKEVWSGPIVHPPHRVDQINKSSPPQTHTSPQIILRELMIDSG